MASCVGIPKTLGSDPFPYRKGDADSDGRCFLDCVRRTAPGNPPFAREPGRLPPDVLQFVDPKPTGSYRGLERQRNPSLRGERMNTVTGIRLREPGPKPETRPSVIDTMGTHIVLDALRLRTCPGIHLGVGTE